jgi:hypothetical protein
MKRTLLLGLVTLAAWSNQAFSQGWTPEQLSIATIHTGHDSSSFYLYTTGSSSVISCGPSAPSTLWQFRTADATPDRQKRAYAALLLAFAMSKKVQLYTTGCANGYQTFDAAHVSH